MTRAVRGAVAAVRSPASHSRTPAASPAALALPWPRSPRPLPEAREGRRRRRGSPELEPTLFTAAKVVEEGREKMDADLDRLMRDNGSLWDQPYR